jgi:hypothetical protein
VTEAGVEDVAPDGKPLHLRCLDVSGQTNDQQVLKKIKLDKLKASLLVRFNNIICRTPVISRACKMR